MSVESLDDALTAIRDALVSDEELKQWSIDNLGGPYIVYLGVDPRQFPESTFETPLIIIFGGGESDRGQSKGISTYTIDIGVTIRNKEIVTSPGESVTFTGLILVEQFRKSVENALSIAQFGRVDVSGSTLPENNFPEFVSLTQLNIVVKQQFRASNRR